MQIKKVNVEQFECPICKTLYDREQDAQICFDNNAIIEKFKDIPPYTYVELKNKLNKVNDSVFVFISECQIEYKYSSKDTKCRNKSIYLSDAVYNHYFSTDDWNIVGYFTMEEYYEKTGIYPKPGKYPEDIIERIYTIIEKEKNKIMNRLNGMNKDELINELKLHYEIFKM